MVDVNEFSREVICEYKGELYSVRDNGAVMRHQREGQKVRKMDNIWTFGKKNKSNGYMHINNHCVHIIIAKAFIPGNEDGKMVVDHIDTNRCNNRVENLRWLTRLENVLLNEATLKRVTYLCGGDISKFINNPSCLRDLSGDNQDIMWMRTVTPEEAKKAWEHISAWAKRPTSTFKMMQRQDGCTKDFEEWLNQHKPKEYELSKNDKRAWEDLKFGLRTDSNKQHIENEVQETITDEPSPSMTEGAYQVNFHERMFFPLCPNIDTTDSLDSYARILKKGDVIARNEKGTEYIISSVGWGWEWDSLQVEYTIEGRKTFSYIHISYEERRYIHRIGEYESNFRFCDSQRVLQRGAATQFYFPLCPKDGDITLEEYSRVLHKGAICTTCEYGNSYVYDREIGKSEEGTPILYVGVKTDNPIKDYADMIIFIENGRVVHQMGRTYFDEKYLQRAFCKIRGQKWKGEEVFDDYC